MVAIKASEGEITRGLDARGHLPNRISIRKISQQLGHSPLFNQRLPFVRLVNEALVEG